jgi:hypothetical protein
MKTTLLLLFFLLTVFFSCKKTDNSLSFQGGTYAFLRVEDGKASGYTKGRELTPDELTRYIADAMFLFDPINNKPRLSDTISFLNHNRVAKNKSGLRSWLYEVQGNTIKYTSDPLIGTYCTASYPNTCLDDLYLWKEDSIGSLPTGGRPLTTFTIYSENTFDGDNIIVPVLCFKKKDFKGVVENYFDKSYLNLLQENDTIAVKEYKMIFKRIN